METDSILIFLSRKISKKENGCRVRLSGQLYQRPRTDIIPVASFSQYCIIETTSFYTVEFTGSGKNFFWFQSLHACLVGRSIYPWSLPWRSRLGQKKHKTDWAHCKGFVYNATSHLHICHQFYCTKGSQVVHLSSL